MKILLAGLLCLVVCASAGADSMRCGGKLVRPGESSNALIKKCGKPERKYSGRQTAGNRGGRQNVVVSNWVYERRGRKDMIVSVRGGTVVAIRVDRG